MDIRISYTINEVAEITTLGRPLIYAEIKRGKLRARKVGRRTIVIAHDLREYLNSLPQCSVALSKRPREAGAGRAAQATAYEGTLVRRSLR